MSEVNHQPNVQKAVAFFSQAGLTRLLLLLREKYIERGQVGGQIVLEESTPEERRNLSSLLGKPTYRDGPIRVKLVEIDNALQQLATSSAQLGAYQNRFQAAITGLTTNSTNLTSARSQIQDTDYAQATSQLSKAQILQQASTAMVSQANTIPQNILTLLQKLP